MSRARDDRQVLNGIFWRLRTGVPWADIPARYGPHITCVNRFIRWRRAGVWAMLLREVSKAYNGDIQMIDSSSIRVHQHAANGKKSNRFRCMGRSRGGLTTKIHALVDATGRPIQLCLTAGQAYDGHIGEAMLGQLPNGCYLMADRAYDSKRMRKLLEDPAVIAVIPSMPQRNLVLPYDTAMYKERNYVERFFNKLKHLRAITTSNEKGMTMLWHLFSSLHCEFGCDLMSLDPSYYLSYELYLCPWPRREWHLERFAVPVP